MRQSARQRGMAGRRKQLEKGFAALAMMLVTAAVALILASVMIPSILEAKRVFHRNIRCGSFESIRRDEYDICSRLRRLCCSAIFSGNSPTTALPAGCNNAFLLNQGQVVGP